MAKTPLEILALRFLAAPRHDETAAKVFAAYDAFLALLKNKEEREYIESLSLEATWDDHRYKEVHQHTRVFQDGLISLFFDDDKPQHTGCSLGELTRHYGVF